MHYKFNGFYEIGGNYKGRVSEEKKTEVFEAINNGGRERNSYHLRHGTSEHRPAHNS
jgi:hypothetical protein